MFLEPSKSGARSQPSNCFRCIVVEIFVQIFEKAMLVLTGLQCHDHVVFLGDLEDNVFRTVQFLLELYCTGIVHGAA